MSITQILQNESMILPQNESTTQENIFQKNRNRDGEDLFPLLFFILLVFFSLIALMFVKITLKKEIYPFDKEILWLIGIDEIKNKKEKNESIFEERKW